MQFQVTTIHPSPGGPPPRSVRVDFERPTSEQGAEDRRDVLVSIFRVEHFDVLAVSSQAFVVVIRL